MARTNTSNQIDHSSSTGRPRLNSIDLLRGLAIVLMALDHTRDTSSERVDKTLAILINYGHILTAVSFIIAGTVAFFGMKIELQNLDQRVAKVETTLQQLASVVVQTARQDERLNAIERRVDRIEQTSPRRPP